MFLQLKRSPDKGQCHKHGPQDHQKEKNQTKLTLHVSLSPRCSLHRSCLSGFHMAPLNLGLHFSINSVIFFYFSMPVYIFHDFMPKTTHTSLAKVQGHPAQLGIISANKASSEAKGCPGCPRNAGLALGCLDYLPVFAQHQRRGHYSFRKAFHLPDAKNHQTLLHKNMCRQHNGDGLSLCSQMLKSTFCRSIRIPAESFAAV